MSSQVTASPHTQKPKYKSKDKPKITKEKGKGKAKQKQPAPSASSQAPRTQVFPPHDDLSPSSEEEELDLPGTTRPTATAAPNESLVPPGSVLLTEVVDGDDFDYDKLKSNEDLELWVVRVPDGVKPKHLTHVSLSTPPTLATTSQKVGSLNRKHSSYDVWSISSSSITAANPADMYDDGDGVSRGNAVGGEELLSMNVLLPRKKKGGRLFVAPKPITQHFVLTAQPPQPSLPTPPASPTLNSSTSAPDANTTESMYKSPARYQHPKHLLKHRFVPTGAGLRVPPPSMPSTQTGDVRKQGMDASAKPNEAAVQSSGDAEKVKKDKEKEKGKHKKKEKKKVVIEEMDSTPKKKRKADGEGKTKTKKTKIEP